MTTIGFIGLGRMGSAMARRMLRCGETVLVNDIHREATDGLAAEGAHVAASATDLAYASDVVFTSLPGPVEIAELAFGDASIIEPMAPGTLWVDVSTNSLACVRRIDERARAAGVRFLDAPVSGGPSGAGDGTLVVWIGGDPADVERADPWLRILASSVQHVGPVGCGTVTKLVHNAAAYAIQTAIAETFALGVKAGVEPLRLWTAIREGAAGRRRTFDGIGPRYLTGSYEPADFALGLARKDLLLATELAREIGVSMRVVDLALAELTDAAAQGWQHLDARAGMRLAQERAGVGLDVDLAEVQRILSS
jgi:3-hydroxyisobutyrate dehydrogenase